MKKHRSMVLKGRWGYGKGGKGKGARSVKRTIGQGIVEMNCTARKGSEEEKQPNPDNEMHDSFNSNIAVNERGEDKR